jgi:ssDNA-binding Zn-finger/Zn-ribbon topoisomerase 1
MNCPDCGSEMSLKSPDYGRGSEWACYGCSPYGARRSSRSFSEEDARQADTEQAASKTYGGDKP